MDWRELLFYQRRLGLLCHWWRQWSLWSVGGWESVPGAQQPLLHFQQLLPLGNWRLQSDGAGGLDIQLKWCLSFSLTRLVPTDQLYQTAFITERKTNTTAHSFHGNIHVKKNLPHTAGFVSVIKGCGFQWTEMNWTKLARCPGVGWWTVSWLTHSCGFGSQTVNWVELNWILESSSLNGVGYKSQRLHFALNANQ